VNLKRRELIGGSLALATLLLTGEPAQAKDISLGKAALIKVGAAKVFTIAGSRILVYRVSTAKYVGFIASCPHDATKFLVANVKAGKVSCPKDKSVFSATTGKKASGPSTKSLKRVPLKVAKGVLIASLAAAPIPVPSASATTSGEELVSSAKVPVGGGLKVSSSRGEIMVVQPSAGKFAAFSTICNHAGCAVSRVTAKAIICECHGSEFSTSNGSVAKGPATQALKQYPVVEKSGAVYLL
jgi:nitrite reductase/ring-hydroxylating ferredoxin subunit